MTREEMIAALEGQSAPSPSPSPTQGPSREEMIAALEQKEPSPSYKDMALKGLYYATKPLDFLGGLARTTAGTVAGQAGVDDWKEALKANAPPSSEYLKRAGVPEGGSLSDVLPGMYSDTGDKWWKLKKGGMLDPTARGVAGFALDTATDPLTYLGMPGARASLQEAGKAGQIADRALHPIEGTLQGAGKASYRSAPIMKASDAVNDRFGKQAASDVLFQNGVWGTGRQIADQAENLAAKTGKSRDALLKQSDDAGAILDMNKATQPAQNLVDEIKASRDPNRQALADALQGKIDEYKALNPRPEERIPGNTSTKEVPIGTMPDSWDLATKTVTEQTPEKIIPGFTGVNPSTGSGYKSSLYHDTGNAAYDSLMKTPTGDKGKKALAYGLDQETSAAADRAIPGVGPQIDQLNDTWGALLTPRKALENEALKGERKNLVTSVDGALVGLTHADPTVLAAKKTSDLLKTNYARTGAGLLMNKVGSAPGLDELARRLYLNNSYKNPDDENSAWANLRR